MKVLFWGQEFEDIITELKGLNDSLEYRPVSSMEELESLLESEEMSVIFIDADDKLSELEQITQKLQDQFSHCPIIISFKSKKLKKVQQSCSGVEKFLQRPHDAKEILTIVDECRSQLLADNPADMRKGGTEDIDMGLVMGSANPLEMKLPTAEELKETTGEVNISDEEGLPGEDEILFDNILSNQDHEDSSGEKSQLEDIDNEKEGLVLDDSGDEGEITVHTSSDVGLELASHAGQEDKSGELNLNTDIFDLPEGLNDDLEADEDGEEDSPQLQEQQSDDEEAPAPAEESPPEPTSDALPPPPPVIEPALDAAPDISPPALDIGELKKESESIAQHHGDELLHLKATIENLRNDRELLLKKITEKERAENELRYKHNGLQAALDEAKIEIIFLKKRYEKELDEINYTAKLAQEKRDVLLEKNKKLQHAVELAKGQATFDMKKIQEREKGLESQLELLKADSENLVKNRDKIIMDLKRKIDTLEFDFETVSEKEKQAREDRMLLEDRLERIMGTLRRTIGNLNEDLMAEKNEDQDKKLVGP